AQVYLEVHLLVRYCSMGRLLYKGRPKLYSADTKNPQRRLVYENIVKDLNEGVSISKIAKNYNVTRQTIYRIKKDLNL
ncbi:hypothetical protein BS082_12650, partial [Enterococcus faecium]|uniref:helix-turn-helix domain-containing protein n=1 Tax=Enterococcus faecium TaxID=1352 RepID=UPI000D809878